MKRAYVIVMLCVTFSALMAVQCLAGSETTPKQTSTEPQQGKQSSTETQPQPQEQAAVQGTAKISEVLGKSVVNRDNEKLGTAEDVVINQNGDLEYLVLSRGGVLGIGDRLIPLPWDAVQLNKEKGVIVVDIHEQQLTNAPSYAKDDWKAFEQLHQDKKVQGYYASKPQSGKAKPGEAQKPQGTDTESEDLTKQPPKSETMQEQGLLRVNEVMGKAVKNTRGEELGTVEDLAVGAKQRISYVILSHGGLLGIGDRLIPLPWSAVQLDQKANVVIVKTDKKQLEKAPNFARNEWTKLDQPDWTDKIASYFGSKPESGQNAESRVQKAEAGKETVRKPDRTTQIVGNTVKNPQGEELGKVEDLVFGENGCIRYLAVSYGSSLGMGGRLIPIPWSVADLGGEKGTVIVNADKQKLEKAPSLESKDWPIFQKGEWDKKVDEYYGVTYEGVQKEQ